MAVGGVVTRIVQPPFEQPGLARPAQDAGSQVGREQIGEKGEDIEAEHATPARFDKLSAPPSWRHPEPVEGCPPQAQNEATRVRVGWIIASGAADPVPPGPQGPAGRLEGELRQPVRSEKTRG